MAHDAEETEQTIEEASAGAGVGSNTISANPGEKVHLDVVRIDAAGASDPWRVAVEVSTAPGSRWSDPPIRNRRLTAAQTNPGFVVSGYYGYRIWVENDDDDPTDVVEVVVRYRGDGVNI